MNTQEILKELKAMLNDGGTLSNWEILERMEQILTAQEEEYTPIKCGNEKVLMSHFVGKEEEDKI